MTPGEPSRMTDYATRAAELRYRSATAGDDLERDCLGTAAWLLEQNVLSEQRMANRRRPDKYDIPVIIYWIAVIALISAGVWWATP